MVIGKETLADFALFGCLMQRAIRNFLKVRTSYDVLPLSFRLIIFDTSLSVKESLNILIQNGMYRPVFPVECWKIEQENKIKSIASGLGARLLTGPSCLIPRHRLCTYVGL